MSERHADLAGSDLPAREPASTFELSVDEVDLLRPCMRNESDHQRGGKRPRLRGVITHRVDFDAGFFPHLTGYCVLEAFAGLYEPGNRRITARRPGGLATEQRSLSVRDQDDDRRIDSRELLDRAARVAALLHVTRLERAHRGAAAAAEAVPVAPMKHRTRVGEQSRFVRRELACDRSKIARLDRFIE